MELSQAHRAGTSPVVRPPAPAPSLPPEPHSVPGVPGLFVLLAGGGGDGGVVVSASCSKSKWHRLLLGEYLDCWGDLLSSISSLSPEGTGNGGLPSLELDSEALILALSPIFWLRRFQGTRLLLKSHPPSPLDEKGPHLHVDLTDLQWTPEGMKICY